MTDLSLARSPARPLLSHALRVRLHTCRCWLGSRGGIILLLAVMAGIAITGPVAAQPKVTIAGRGVDVLAGHEHARPTS